MPCFSGISAVVRFYLGKWINWFVVLGSINVCHENLFSGFLECNGEAGGGGW